MALIRPSKTNDVAFNDNIDDMFLYDTTTDSDGGAWTKRFRNTSWYKQTGSDFPKVALITVYASTLKIYDATKEDTPLWFTSPKLVYWGGAASAVKAKNGIIVIGDESSSNNHGLAAFDFPRDMHVSYDYAHNFPFIDGGTVSFNNNSGIERYSETKHPLFRNVSVRIDGQVYHIDMTVHPNTPPSPDTGLPLPSIAWVASFAANGSGVNFVFPYTPYVNNYNVLNSETQTVKHLAIQWTSTNYYFTSIKWSANGRDILLGIEYEPGQNYDTRYMYVTDVIDYSSSTHGININNLRRNSNPSIHERTKWNSSDPYRSEIADHVDNIFALSDSQNGISLFKWQDNSIDTSWVARLQRESSFSYNGGEAYPYNTGWLQKNQVFAFAENSSKPSTYSTSGSSLISNSNQESYVQSGASGTGIYFNANGDTPRATWNNLRPFTNYRFTFNVTAASGSPTMYIDDDSGAFSVATTRYLDSITMTNGSSYEILFKTTRSPKFRIINGAGASGSFTIDSIKLIEVPTDLSNFEYTLGSNKINNVSIHGNIQSTAVATNSDVHSLNLNSASFIKLPYIAERQLGTTYTVMWWGKYLSSQTWDLLLSLSDNTASNHGAGIGFRSTGISQLSVSNYLVNSTVTFDFPGSDQTKEQGQFQHWCVTCDGTNGTRVFVNGLEATRSSSANISLSLPTNASAFYSIGCEGSTTYNANPIDGRSKEIAMFRMSRYPTTPEMARWIYHHELPLFADQGVKSLVPSYGSTMDYDYHTRTLHCGSGSDGSYKLRGLEVLETDNSVNADRIVASNDIVFKRQ